MMSDQASRLLRSFGQRYVTLHRGPRESVAGYLMGLVYHARDPWSDPVLCFLLEGEAGITHIPIHHVTELTRED